MKRPYARTLVVATLMVAASACQPAATATPPPPDYAATLGPVADKFIGVWNTEDYSLLDSIMPADFRRTAPNGNAGNLAEMKEFMKRLHTAYSDFHIVVDESAFKENVGFVEWTVTGTSTGSGGKKAAGKPVKISGATVLKFRDGKIAEEIAYFDTASLQAQLGAPGMPRKK